MTDSLQQEIQTLRSLFWSPRDPQGRAFAPLADAYRRAGDFRQAVEILRDGLERHPDFLSGHVVAAQLYFEKGLLEEAELATRRAVELDGDNELAWELLAGVLEGKGDLEGGREIRTRLAPEPEPEAVMELAALAPEPAPEPEPVMELAELAPEPAPEPEPVMELEALAPEAANAQDDEELPSDDVSEETPMVTRTMAELYERQGLTDRALDVYRQLLGRDPDNADLLARVARLTGVAAEAPPEPAPRDAPPHADARDEDEDADHHWTAGPDAAQHDVDTPFAWTAEEEAGHPVAEEPAVSSYFSRMLSWTPDDAEPGEADAAGGEA